MKASTMGNSRDLTRSTPSCWCNTIAIILLSCYVFGVHGGAFLKEIFVKRNFGNLIFSLFDVEELILKVHQNYKSASHLSS